MQIADNQIYKTFSCYFKYWPYFILSFVFCLLAGFIYINISKPQYKVISKVLITDEKKGKMTTTPIYDDLGIVNSNNIDNEIEILSSRSLMQMVFDSLGFYVSYYIEEEGNKTTELYRDDLPIIVTIEDFKSPGEFLINRDDNGQLLFCINESCLVIQEGIPFDSPLGKLKVTSNVNFSLKFKQPLLIHIKEPGKIPSIQVKSVNKTSSVVEMSLITTNPAKGMDIINTLVNVYNEQTIKQRNAASINTLTFINERLNSIATELENAEFGVESYKKNNKLTNLQSEANLFLSSSSEYNKKINEIEVELSMLRFMRDYLQSAEKEGDIMPANIGISDPSITTLIQKYNELQFEKVLMNRGFKENNPLIIDLNERISLIKHNLLKSINNAESSFELTRDELHKQENIFSNKITKLPTQEKEYQSFFRQKEIKEALFIYLMQKREETALSIAIDIPNAQIIDAVYVNPIPVIPKKNMILLFSILLSIIIPAVIIYVLNILDDKVRSKDEFQQLFTAPLLGELPFDKSRKEIVVNDDTYSAIAESFRLIAAKIHSMLKSEESQVITLTSTHHNEAKTYIALNLALSMAETGKKILFLDADMRNSKLKKILKLPDKKGFIAYLSSEECELTDVITKSLYNSNLDIIFSERSVHNPISLLTNKRMDHLFLNLTSSYDYILIDTAPVGMFADAILLNSFSNCTLYTGWLNHTLKKELGQSETLYSENKLNNIFCVLRN